MRGRRDDRSTDVGACGAAGHTGPGWGGEGETGARGGGAGARAARGRDGILWRWSVRARKEPRALSASAIELYIPPHHKILAGCGGSVSLLVRPMFTLLYFTYFTAERRTRTGVNL